MPKPGLCANQDPTRFDGPVHKLAVHDDAGFVETVQPDGSVVVGTPPAPEKEQH